MSKLVQLIKSKAYQQFMRKLFFYAVSVFILGVLFLIMRWPGGNIMAIVGGCCLIFCGFSFLIGKLILRDHPFED